MCLQSKFSSSCILAEMAQHLGMENTKLEPKEGTWMATQVQFLFDDMHSSCPDSMYLFLLT